MRQGGPSDEAEGSSAEAGGSRVPWQGAPGAYPGPPSAALQAVTPSLQLVEAWLLFVCLQTLAATLPVEPAPSICICACPNN